MSQSGPILKIIMKHQSLLDECPCVATGTYNTVEGREQRGECIGWTGKKSTDLGMMIAAATCKGECCARVEATDMSYDVRPVSQQPTHARDKTSLYE